MSVLSYLADLFGVSDPFGGHDPEDLEVFWRIDYELSLVDSGLQTEAQALANLELESVDQAERVKGAFAERHIHDPAFRQAALEFQTRVHLTRRHRN